MGAVLALGALFFLRAVAGIIVDALIRVWWFLDGLPQALVWGMVFGALALVFVVGVLRGQSPQPERTPRRTKRSETEFAQLVDLLRKAEQSTSAQQRLARRLARLAVNLRTNLELISVDQAWAAWEEGHWPQNKSLIEATEPARHPWSVSRQRGYLDAVDRAVDALWHYAKGGRLDHP